MLIKPGEHYQPFFVQYLKCFKIQPGENVNTFDYFEWIKQRWNEFDEEKGYVKSLQRSEIQISEFGSWLKDKVNFLLNG